ncbi:cysteine desulfurase [Cohaesibacter marisflavi]|uniref:Cysteine desulfurase n=1 Tax=Cohaesibacter marisflavi TaxID=655353 RepID=A0A1I5FRS2_9HYPH|nr:cysteine desulfurase family protein [Cohaesibacter marisflavi]SFO26457.1 cysteine desulfurase [Cohaesibacter marisflavi]
MQRAYLDHNATSPLRPDVKADIIEAWEVAGNASSVHKEGREARALVEKARQQVADLVGGGARQVIFTSGASEANMLALTPHMKVEYQPDPASALFVSAIEHPSVLSGGRFGAQARREIPVLPNGMVDVSALRLLLEAHDPQTGRPMIAVMAVNSETGVIQPIAEIAALAEEFNAYFHLDAVQAAGRIPLDMTELGCSSLSLSAHKLGGPKGVGALIMAHEGTEPEPLITGGPQENRLRAGTENVAGIVGFGVACQAAGEDLHKSDGFGRLAALRDRFEDQLRALDPDVVIFGADAERVGNTSQFAIPGTKGEMALIRLDLAGVAVSSGSACSSGKVSASHVLLAMGYGTKVAGSAIRMSLGWNSKEPEIDALIEALGQICVKNSKNSLRGIEKAL